MLAEFDLLYRLGWRGSLFLVDDNFIGNRREALRLLRALIPWQRDRHYPFNLYTEASMNLVEDEELMDAMRQAGFTSVFVGIETPTPAALIATKKKQNVRKDDREYPLHAIQALQEKGFEILGGFILGLDGDTPEVFDLHIRFIQQAAIAIAMEGLLTVLKGADLYHTRLKAYVREVVAQVRREYSVLHKDFRHDVDDALSTSARALDASPQAFHLRIPHRVS